MLTAWLLQCAGPTRSSQTKAPLPESMNAADSSFTLGYIQGKFDPATYSGFTEIDTMHADRAGLFLREDAYDAFVRMYNAASADGIILVIRSATRNFDYQKGIWERKWKGETKIEGDADASVKYLDPKDRALAILRFSSMPGTSRHHWGTDIDLNAFENSWFESGEGGKIFAWLMAHAHEYGYCQPYTPKGIERPDGYEEEKWHWSYIPVAGQLTALARDSLKNEMITGFEGAAAAVEIDVVGKYVLGVNDKCLSYD